MSHETNTGIIDLLPRLRTAADVVGEIESLQGIDTSPQGEIVFALSRDEKILLPDGQEVTDSAVIAILLSQAISERFTGRVSLRKRPHQVPGFENISERCVLPDGFTICADQLVQVQPADDRRPAVKEFTITAGYNLADLEG